MDILWWLRLPEARGITDLDSPKATEIHGHILDKKIFLKKLYSEFYRQFAETVQLSPGKTAVEIGSGGGFLKKVIPQGITSDIISAPGVDMRFSAEKMPFDNNSVDAFFMFNVFHHIKDPRAFLSEAARCLKPGGEVVMIEPANTIWGRFIYKNFHHEDFDASAGWQVGGAGPLSASNSAMPYIVFVRDREQFEAQFKTLKIKNLYCHTPFSYLISGGFSMRQLLPGCLFGLVRFGEYLLSPLNNYLGMFMTINIIKSGDSTL
jgi:SAM-dependent methyltransferase